VNWLRDEGLPDRVATLRVAERLTSRPAGEFQDLTRSQGIRPFKTSSVVADSVARAGLFGTISTTAHPRSVGGPV
jgi:hypothetical protein